MPAKTGTEDCRHSTQTSFVSGSSSDTGSDLVRYLEGFAHTTALMQTREQIERVAAESAIDLARDGVVYAEVRFAPEQHLNGRLTLHEVVRAALDGFALGMKEAANEGHRIVVRAILSAMRQANVSETIAQLAIDFRDEGVCGFDIAGPEDGFPPTSTCGLST